MITIIFTPKTNRKSRKKTIPHFDCVCKSRRVLTVFISIPFGTEQLLGTLRFSEWKNYRQLINTMPLCAFSLHRFSDNFTRQLAGVCSLFYQQFSHLMGHGSSLLGKYSSFSHAVWDFPLPLGEQACKCFPLAKHQVRLLLLLFMFFSVCGCKCELFICCCIFFLLRFLFLLLQFFLGFFPLLQEQLLGQHLAKFSLYIWRGKCRECWSFSCSPHQTPYSSHAPGI